MCSTIKLQKQEKIDRFEKHFLGGKLHWIAKKLPKFYYLKKSVRKHFKEAIETLKSVNLCHRAQVISFRNTKETLTDSNHS